MIHPTWPCLQESVFSGCWLLVPAHVIQRRRCEAVCRTAVSRTMSAIYPLLFTNCLFMSKIQSRIATCMYLIDTAGDWNMKSPDHSSLVRKKVDGTDRIPGVGDLGGRVHYLLAVMACCRACGTAQALGGTLSLWARPSRHGGGGGGTWGGGGGGGEETMR